MNHPAQPLIAPTPSEAESHVRLKKGVRTAQLRKLLDEANEAYQTGLNDPENKQTVDWDARLEAFESRRRLRWGAAVALLAVAAAVGWSQLPAEGSSPQPAPQSGD